MTEQQIEELVYQIWLATGAEDDATKPPIRQAIIQAINMTKDEDAEICEKIGNQVEFDRPNKYMGDSALDAAETILSTKIKET